MSRRPVAAGGKGPRKKFSKARDPDQGQQDRLAAALGLAAVLRDRRTLDQYTQSLELSPLANELLYGSTRHYRALAARLQPLLERPLRRKDQDVWALLIVGAYQLFFTRVPDHAALAATVAAAKLLKQPWAVGLINACLRSLVRGRALTPALADDPTIELPSALLTQLRTTYKGATAALVAALAERAPMALRVNQAREGSENYAGRLEASGLAYQRGQTPATLILDQPTPVAQLPGYAEGCVSVQDAGAQLAALALAQIEPPEPPPNGAAFRVLDACAAPGGKLFHYLEQSLSRQPEKPAFGNLQLTGLELSPNRLSHLEAEANRLGHAQRPELQLLGGDATGRDWWDGQYFDLILVDAPCSGSGTLRRHPDIKLLRDFEQLDEDIALQNALLDNLLPLLRPGGRMLYATCSLLPAENDARIARALRSQPDTLRSVAFALPTGVATKHGWQLLPTDPNTDGFYYAGVEHLE